MLEIPSSTIKSFVPLRYDDAIVWTSVRAFIERVHNMFGDMYFHNVYLAKRNRAFEGADTTPPPRYHTTTLKVFRER